MNTQRLTISLPTPLFRRLKQKAGQRETSQIISQALEQYLATDYTHGPSPTKDFLAFRSTLPPYDGNVEDIIEAIHTGRT